VYCVTLVRKSLNLDSEIQQNSLNNQNTCLMSFIHFKEFDFAAGAEAPRGQARAAIFLILYMC
jgi:hypothetical protein